MISRILSVALLAIVSIASAQTTQPAGPTRISIDLNDVPLAEAMKKISAETGVAFQMSPSSPRSGAQAAKDIRVTLKADNQPLSRVVADFLVQAKCSAALYREYGGLALSPGAPLSVIPLNDNITLLVQSVVVEGYANLGRGEPTKQYNYTIQCAAIFDPSMRALGASQSANITELNIAAPRSRNQYGSSSQIDQVDGRRFAVLLTSLRFGTAERVTNIEKLVASWRVLCATEDVKVALEAADLINGGENGDERLTISVPPAGNDQRNGVQFSLRGSLLERFKNSPWESIWGTGAVRIDGIDGGPLEGVNANPQGIRGKDITFRIFDNRGGQRNLAEEIDRIQVVLPTKARYIEVPIVLTDLKMP